ncbi:MAG: hypothetical protein P1V97_39365 [Planctomycetota bacterium]|nr:hypothetical protein [Planctomycetota bacterium]
MSDGEEAKNAKETGKTTSATPKVMDVLHKSRPARRKLDIKKKKADPSDKKSCLYCHDSIERHEGHAWCPHCKIAMHKDCAEETVSCPTLGCKKDLLNYTPLSLAKSKNDGLSVFGFSLGQVLYYFPLLALLTGALFGGPSSATLFAFLYAAIVVDWALGVTRLFDSVIDRFRGRRLKLFTVVFPLLILSFGCFRTFSEAQELHAQTPIPILVMGVVFLLGALTTIIAQIFEPAVIDAPTETKPMEQLKDLVAEENVVAPSTEPVQEMVPGDIAQSTEDQGEHPQSRADEASLKT